MATGEIHYLWYKRVFIPIALPIGIIGFFTFFYFQQWEINPYLFIFFYFVNYFLARYIDPDLDQLGLTNAEGRMINKKKGIILSFFGALSISYWFMYAWFVGLFGGHRSWMSHGWIIGTAGRMLYFNIPLVFFTSWIVGKFELNFDWFYVWIIGMPYIISQFLTWAIADSTHLIVDIKR